MKKEIKQCRNMNNRLGRESNAELLRIICIFIILLHHFCVHALYPEVLPLDIIDKGWDSHLLLFIHAFLYIGVNCFVLISGWYGIKPKWRSFVNLYLIYAFYNLLHPFLDIARGFIQGDGFMLPYSLHDIVMHTIFPFGYGFLHLWFMDCYLGLFLMAPMLNIAIKNMNKAQYEYVLLLLSIANVYFGDFWSRGLINSYGFSLANFIYLYIIGGYLHKYITIEIINKNRWRWFSIYCVYGLLWGICSMLSAYHIKVPHWNAFAYNNLFLLLTAIFFFLFMMSWHFKNRFVNYIAASMLGVYMLNAGVVKYEFISPYSHKFTPITQLTLWIGISVGFFIVAVGVDQIRIFLTKPIWLIYNRYIENILSKISEKFNCAKSE